MNLEVRALAEALLRSEPAGSLTLSELHRALVQLAGPVMNGPADLASALLGADRFTLAPPIDPLETLATGWDDDLLDDYQTVIRNVMLGEARVALQAGDRDGAAGAGDPLDLVASSLSRLEAPAFDAGLGDRIAEARAEYGALRRAVVTGHHAGR
jgi:hypothetical protein